MSAHDLKDEVIYGQIAPLSVLVTKSHSSVCVTRSCLVTPCNRSYPTPRVVENSTRLQAQGHLRKVSVAASIVEAKQLFGNPRQQEEITEHPVPILAEDSSYLKIEISYEQSVPLWVFSRSKYYQSLFTAW
ncbi:hypothetical protein J6590_015683 [Homalodisca vitripennis]|nr:hypothetical protein J6590_015683 [Homalodisca vitripennis]